MSPELESPSEQPEMPPTAAAQPNPRPSATPEPAFGWTQYAEILNGRFAMVGFAALLILEFFTHQDFFTWVGLR